MRMGHLSTNQTIGILTALLMVASAVGIAVKWIRVPYSVALVIVGLVIGSMQLLPPVAMTPELILLVCLPALLFEASWNIDLVELKRNWIPISVFATLGVLVSMTICALVLSRIGGVDYRVALLFGALISATDPISVLASFRRLGVDKRLSLLIEGESLFNDGIAVVLFKIVLVIAVTQVVPSPLGGVWTFLSNVLGGTLVGLVIGVAGSRAMKLFDDRLLEITLTAIVAYGSFLVAEQFDVSPVLAVLAAGIVFGNYGSRTAMSPATRLAVNSFWEYAAFVVNSLVFLLIGMQVHIQTLAASAHLIGLGILAILVARVVVVGGLSPFCSSRHLPIPGKWQTMLVWGALRGSLSMAIALSTPLTFPMRDQLITLTFGVVLFTLLVSGATVEPLAHFLGLLLKNEKTRQFSLLQSKLIAENEAMESLQAMYKKGTVSQKNFEVLEKEIVSRQDSLNRRIIDLHIENASIEELQLTQARRHLLEVRKDSIMQLAREENLEPEVVEELMLGFDEKLESIDDRAEQVGRDLLQES